MFFVVKVLSEEIVFYHEQQDEIQINPVTVTKMQAMLPKSKRNFLAKHSAGETMMDAILLKQALPVAEQANVQILTVNGLGTLTNERYQTMCQKQKQWEDDLLMTLTLLIVSPLAFLMLRSMVLPHWQITGGLADTLAFGIVAFSLGLWYMITFSSVAARLEKWAVQRLAKLARMNEN